MHRPGAPLHRWPTQGFTLLELLVVMVIIGMLASFVAPRYFAQVGKSKANVARAQIVALEQALDQFRLDVGRYPSAEEGLAALDQAPSADQSWGGPYLKKPVPLDPWENPTSTWFRASGVMWTSRHWAATVAPAAAVKTPT